MIIRRWHPLQYLLVVLGVILVTLAKLYLPFFEEGLTGTLYIIIIAVTSIIGDYIASALAIILSLIALNFVIPPSGLHLNSTAFYETLELLAAGLLIFFLSKISSILQKEKHNLMQTVNKLEAVIDSLNIEAKGKKNQLSRLQTINKELDSLVHEFIEDDSYWQSKWAAAKRKSRRIPGQKRDVSSSTKLPPKNTA